MPVASREDHMKSTVALDLGSTRFKAGRLVENRLQLIGERPSLPVIGSDPFYEHDARKLLPLVQQLLPAGPKSLALSVQRSTCLFWDPVSAKSLTPMVSWRDRRAAGWCETHKIITPQVWSTLGLPLSPHYAGPTAAALMEQYPELRDRLRTDRALFGTMDSYLIYVLSNGRHHVTDVSVAARTLLFDPAAGGWGGAVLAAIDLPKSALPKVVSSVCDLELGRCLRLRALLADQSAATLASISSSGDEILVNVGTGTFVIYPTGDEWRRIGGCLTAPLLQDGGRRLYAVEGTINSPVEPADFAYADRTEKLYCLPDKAGLGAPFWQESLTRCFSTPPPSAEAESLAVAEGMIFRVRQLIELIAPDPDIRVVLSGGGASSSWTEALASCIERPIYLAEEPHASLLGAARVSTYAWQSEPPARTSIHPASETHYLAKKYLEWSRWLQSLNLKTYQSQERQQ